MSIRTWWYSRSASERRILLLASVFLGALAFGFSSYAVKQEQDRLRKAIPLANIALQRMQDDATEVDRLRAQTPIPPPQGQALVGALTASIRSHGLDLTLTTEGADRFRVQGRVGFDQAVAWLAAVQRDYQLRVTTLAVTRQDGGVKLDAVLTLRSQ
jgi:type II secretory pathway component PulM